MSARAEGRIFLFASSEDSSKYLRIDFPYVNMQLEELNLRCKKSSHGEDNEIEILATLKIKP